MFHVYFVPRPIKHVLVNICVVKSDFKGEDYASVGICYAASFSLNNPYHILLPVAHHC